jgi:glutathione peroxidase
MATFFDIPVQSLGGTPDLLGPLRGKVVLAVNVASRCGLTPQYTGLESLQSDLDAQKFSVVGFPCNQFGGQEPGTEREIAQFCSATYGVTFPMSAKLDVNGIHRHAVYRYLTSSETGVAGDIEWNFEKFLISREGRVIKRYPPGTEPQDTGLLQDIADAL